MKNARDFQMAWAVLVFSCAEKSKTTLMFLTTVSLWQLYEILITDWPLILANICAVTAMLIIVATKLKYK